LNLPERCITFFKDIIPNLPSIFGGGGEFRGKDFTGGETLSRETENYYLAKNHWNDGFVKCSRCKARKN
jgi:hypothetical protein